MKTRISMAAGTLILLIAFAGCSQPAQSPTPIAPAAAATSRVERGKMLVMGGACHDCHTPKKVGPMGPEADREKALSGHQERAGVLTHFTDAKNSPYSTHANDDLTAWSGPWGVSYAANLTPDETTGIGLWSEDSFVKAIKTGKHMGAGRAILPPMPWFWYNQIPDDDLKAIFAYLKSLPPIANRVPPATGPDGKPLS
jgi:mono/diheme cytochrome c family protein